MRIRIQQLKLMRIQIRNPDNGKISVCILRRSPFSTLLVLESFLKSAFINTVTIIFYVQMVKDETFTDENILFHNKQIIFIIYNI